jgi:hypothetical protein
MHPRTVATLQQLEKADWFSRVGVKDTEAAIVLSSWQEAIQQCSSVEWENVSIEAANQYRERLIERSIERYRQWNTIVDEVRKTTVPFVKSRIEGVVKGHSLPKVFEDTVQWDILHVGMEAEYADVYQPGFYASQAFWYLKGHFPCGWDGEFPKGKIIIF